MSSFKDPLNHGIFKCGFFEEIINYLIHCSNLMLSDAKELLNDENEITYCFVETYLDNDNIKTSQLIKAKFDVEIQENYNHITKKYKGRTDIRVITENIFNNRNNYYIIECKRIDGDKPLNTKYINDGINRFVIEKYTSYNNKNIMFGFVVKDIDIKANTIKISNLQSNSELNKNSIKSGFIEKNSRNNIFALYSSEYMTCTSKHLELRHLFYNFHSII